MYANDLTADEVIALLGAEMQSPGGTPANVRGWSVATMDRAPFGSATLTVEHPEWGQRRWRVTAAAL